jgi:excisionase family DNA binding protein
MDEREKVLTVAELAEYLRVHPSTIYRLLKRRQVPAFRVAGDWRFNREQIDEWRKSLEQVSAEARVREGGDGDTDDR